MSVASKKWLESTYRRGGEHVVHRQPVDCSDDFCPLERWSGWNRAKHERFNWLAGAQLRALGYQTREFEGEATRWTAWNQPVA